MTQQQAMVLGVNTEDRQPDSVIVTFETHDGFAIDFEIPKVEVEGGLLKNDLIAACGDLYVISEQQNVYCGCDGVFVIVETENGTSFFFGKGDILTYADEQCVHALTGLSDIDCQAIRTGVV